MQNKTVLNYKNENIPKNWQLKAFSWFLDIFEWRSRLARACFWARWDASHDVNAPLCSLWLKWESPTVYYLRKERDKFIRIRFSVSNIFSHGIKAVRENKAMGLSWTYIIVDHILIAVVKRVASVLCLPKNMLLDCVPCFHVIIYKRFYMLQLKA